MCSESQDRAAESSWKSVHTFARIVCFSAGTPTLPALFVPAGDECVDGLECSQTPFHIEPSPPWVLRGQAEQSEREQCVAKSSGSGVQHRSENLSVPCRFLDLGQMT